MFKVGDEFNLKFKISKDIYDGFINIFNDKNPMHVDERIIDQIINDNPLKKILSTCEVAESVSYLVNSSQQINGIDLVINSADNII